MGVTPVGGQLDPLIPLEGLASVDLRLTSLLQKIVVADTIIRDPE